MTPIKNKKDHHCNQLVASILAYICTNNGPMARKKIYKLHASNIVPLVPPMGGCIATDKITVDGEPVRFMFRDSPENDMDSGWQFFSGTEDQAYIDDPENSGVYDVNTIANYDRAIIPYIQFPVGTDLERIPGTDRFQVIPG